MDVFFPQMDAFVHDQLQIMKCYNTITARRHHLINSTAISTSVAIVDSTITKEKWMEDTFHDSIAFLTVQFHLQRRLLGLGDR